MKTKVLIFIHALLLICFSTRLGAQNVSDEAKRYFDRGVAALEMATSPSEYDSAVTKFRQAAVLAPDWPDVYYNLGLAQEKAEKYSDAVISLRQYLKLSPNASDAEAVKTLISKLEYKIEESVFTIPSIFTPNGDGKNDKFFIDS
jgi:tetratricopeptide (TPR) repeat protein